MLIMDFVSRHLDRIKLLLNDKTSVMCNFRVPKSGTFIFLREKKKDRMKAGRETSVILHVS